MVFKRGGCVYILTNKDRTVLYTGVTSDIAVRIWEHKNKIYPNSFTSKYKCDKLVYYYFYSSIQEAISEEKRIKGSSRAHKEGLINALNAGWRDLYDSLLE
jgi:putative endonuclease